MCMPPAESSEGSLKLLIVTPGSPLKASNEINFFNDTLSKMVPNAVSLSLEVDIVQSKLGLCSK